MKLCQGLRSKLGTVVTVTQGSRSSELDPRFDLRNHSPTGFEWGYGGSGPAQLALAILADHFGNDEIAQRFYQDFKFKVVGRFTEDEWTLSSKDIDSAIRELKHGEVTNG
jgi:hypothetical protein